MHQVYACLMQQHDWRLVLVAGVTCLLASWTALSLARRGTRGARRACTAWLAVAAVVTGCGIWATHFIAMLAFAAGLPVGYEPGLTVLSVLVAIAITGGGFAIASGGGMARLWMAGAVVGAGVGAMHYTGMAALRVPAFVSWDAVLVVASLLLGVGFGAAAARIALAGGGPARTAAGALLLTVGICALHFTAMGALRLAPTPLLPIPEHQLSSSWLALGVAAATAVILAAAMAGMIVDSHLAGRTAREASRLRALVDATFEGIVIHAGGTIVDLNERLAELLGRGREELLGRPVLDALAPEWADEARSRFASGGTAAWEAELVRADGARVPVDLLGRPIEHQDGRRAHVVAVRDVSERRRAEERIRHLAHHDALTDLPNRALLADRLAQALARTRRRGGGGGRGTVAVLCLDLDRFKAVNDTLGHPVGDALLRVVADRLRGCVREEDTVARLGGDEFAVVQDGLDQPEGAAALAQRLIEVVGEPYEVGGHQLVVGASVGLALAPGDGDGPDELLKKADMALYRAKADGRGTYRSFEPAMDAKLQARRLLELDLRKALVAGEFVLHYQPLVDLRSGAVAGFEALLRWRRPARGTVPPGEFVPLAEEIGLIVPIGGWVLRRACADAAGWPEEVKVAVNLSAVQFRGETLVPAVAAALAASGLRPERLELEITEGVLLRDSEATLATLRELRRLGVRIAMDDFGTGYSSLGYLRSFPFDKIKIDRSFVADVATSRDCQAIVRAVTGLADSLGIVTTAEGVETREQIEQLRAEACTEVQGYYFSPPVPAGEVAGLLSPPRSRGARSKWEAGGPCGPSAEAATVRPRARAGTRVDGAAAGATRTTRAKSA
jgi:diguanylate cyclase